MKRSLEDFRGRLIRTMGLGTVLVWVSFAILFQSLVFLLAEKQRDLAENRLLNSLNAFVATHEGKIAIIASHPEFRTYLRSGDEGRTQLQTPVLTLLSSLRDDDVVGVSLVEPSGQAIIASLGEPSRQILGFDLCYIGDQLNAQFGRCSGSVLLYFSESALGRVFGTSDQIVSCDDCGRPLSEFVSTSRFLKPSEKTNFQVRYKPAASSIFTTQLYFLLISILLVGFGFFFRRLVGRAIKQDIVEPLNSLLTHLEKGTHTELSENDSIEEVVALHRHNSALAAVARTTQMLAHDVRKPFNLFRMTLERIRTARSEAELKVVLSEALPEVERSLASVNGLISDVMNVGGEAALTFSPLRLASIVDEACEEVRKLFPRRQMKFEISVPETLWVNGDTARLPRVFLNILSNAVEAVPNGTVRLWVKVDPRKEGGQTPGLAERVVVRVGNTGSFLPEDLREKIFDLFCTSGKRGGTGLGLAIVRRIVAGHGSDVVCHSVRDQHFPEGKVEFVWSLEVVPNKDSTQTQSKPLQLESVQERAEKPNQQKEKPRVIFLDDSPLARWVWDAKLKTDVDVRCFEGPSQLKEALTAGEFKLDQIHTVITDHFFSANESQTGLELASTLRTLGFTGRIFLASNGVFTPEELQNCVDKVVDKNPVNWEQL